MQFLLDAGEQIGGQVDGEERLVVAEWVAERVASTSVAPLGMLVLLGGIVNGDERIHGTARLRDCFRSCPSHSEPKLLAPHRLPSETPRKRPLPAWHAFR